MSGKRLHDDFTKEQEGIIALISKLSTNYATQLKKHYQEENNLRRKKEKKREKFLKSKRTNRFGPTERLRLGLVPQMITQAIGKGIPLREPKRKARSQPELSPLIYQTIVNSPLAKPLIEQSADFNANLVDVEFVPDMVYLQRVDADNSKMLVKMVVNWGYLETSCLDQYLTKENEEIAESRIIVFKRDKTLHGIYPLRHASNYQNDSEDTSRALFVGLIVGLKPDSIYYYRIESFDKKAKKQIAGTNNKRFKTSFKLPEANKPLFFTVCSDLHGGRNGSFMRGEVMGKTITGNLELGKVFNSVASTESEVTFDEGYSMTIATGDLTENASYSEYWVDLFKRCSVLWDHVPLLASIGNHDYYCGGKGKGNKIGGLEEDCRYWHRFITNPNSSSGNVPGHWYSIEMGNVKAIFLDSNGLGWGKYELECGSEQWLWLEEELRHWRKKERSYENTPQYCFVFLHSAIMSLGFWGRGFNRGNDERAQSFLTPLFRKYGVDMVFSGHDHIYQRSKWMGTTYLENGRHGGTTRPYFFWKKKQAVYDIENICADLKTRVYTTVYAPPNQETIEEKDEADYKEFKKKMRTKLLAQPTASNYFFGLRKINQGIGELLDNNAKLKEQLIDEFVLSKLDDHVWLRAYAVEKEYHTGKREIIDMMFLKAKKRFKHNEDRYTLSCPEKVVE